MTRNLLKKSYDIVVIGGGLSACCAAIAAARHGASVAIIQDRPVLGGNSSSEIRVPITGATWGNWGGKPPTNRHARETGIIDEIWMDYCVRDPHPCHSVRDLILLDHVDAEKRIDLYLNYRATEVVMRDAKTIAAVRAEPVVTETPIELEAALFIDGSGDGWIAAQAGAEHRRGREGKDEFGEDLAPDVPDKWTLGNSIYFTARDVGHAVKFAAPDWAIDFDDEKFPLRHHDDPLNQISFWWIEFGGKMNTIDDADAIYRELTRVVMGVWNHIKNSGKHDADRLVLEWIGKVPGRRESRRFMGDHIMRQSDIDDQVLFDDRVAYGGWWLDQHPPGGIYDTEPPCEHPPFHGVYSIPLRSLYSVNVDNLMFAGRHISTTHVAHSSTRVMRTLSVIGQGTGTAAAMCITKNCTPREACANQIGTIQQQLLRDDAYLIGLRNADGNDLARGGHAEATSEWSPTDDEARAFCHSDFPAQNVLSGIARPEKDVSSNLWVSDATAPLPQSITVQLKKPGKIGSVDLRFDTRLDEVHFAGPVMECAKEYSIEVRSDGAWREVASVAGNTRRRRVHTIEPVNGDAVRVTIRETHGFPQASLYEMRVYPPGK